MNKILIFGNGFDLSHGLPTSYKDFINYYLDKVEAGLKLNGFYEDNFYAINTTKFQHAVSVKKDINKLSFKSSFFNSLINKNFNNWIDIENEFYEELKS